jgi:hypothetical protein
LRGGAHGRAAPAKAKIPATKSFFTIFRSPMQFSKNILRARQRNRGAREIKGADFALERLEWPDMTADVNLCRNEPTDAGIKNGENEPTALNLIDPCPPPARQLRHRA